MRASAMRFHISLQAFIRDSNDTDSSMPADRMISVVVSALF